MIGNGIVIKIGKITPQIRTPIFPKTPYLGSYMYPFFAWQLGHVVADLFTTVAQKGQPSWSGPIVFGIGAPHFGHASAESDTSELQSLQLIKAIVFLLC